jgi:Ras family protein T1
MPIKFRPRDVQGVSASRKTFNCLVIGAAGSGKSSFLDTFVGASIEESKEGELVSNKRENTKSVNRSVIKSIKEKDAKQKEKYNIKYLILQEVSDEHITNDKLQRDVSLLNKCDAVIFLFESNDSEQVEFVKNACGKLRDTDELKLVPFILIQTKMDLQMPESGENR